MYFLAEKRDIDFIGLTKQVLNKEKAFMKEEAKVSPINICMSFDDNYLAPALTAIKSLLQHTQSHVDFYILCDKRLSSCSKNVIEKNIPSHSNIYFIEVTPGVLNWLPLNRSYISINTYYRLLIHELIDVEKIIYLDSDIIVADDIEKLWNIDINGFCMAGVLDEGGIMQARRLKLGADSDYINAGVIVFNLKRIKEKYINPLKNYLEAFYYNRQLIILQDQDILNIVFKNDLLVLPLKWNVNGRIFEVNDLDHKYTDQDIEVALSGLGIIHYTDRKKPWKFHATHPLKNLYWHYRIQVCELPLSFSEKWSIFLQKHFKYLSEGKNIKVYCHGIKFSINKNHAKKILHVFHF